MKNEKILKVLAAILAMRAKYYEKRKDHWSASAYESAYFMLMYAACEDWDCLRQFGWSDEAEALINEVGADTDFIKLLTLIKEGK